jgi:hypothetical protein
MIGNASHAVTLASGVARNPREISKKVRPHRIVEEWHSALRAEDHMHHNERKRKWHWRDYMSGLQPSSVNRYPTWGFAPCWYSSALSALRNLAATNLPATAEMS